MSGVVDGREYFSSEELSHRGPIKNGRFQLIVFVVIHLFHFDYVHSFICVSKL